jgi:hypothetical protein
MALDIEKWGIETQLSSNKGIHPNIICHVVYPTSPRPVPEVWESHKLW